MYIGEVLLLTSFFMTSSPVTGAVLGAGHILFASAAKNKYSHDIEHRQTHMYFDIVKSKAHVKYLFIYRQGELSTTHHSTAAECASEVGEIYRPG